MATYDAAITQALDAQEDLKDHPEHCSADPARLATVGRARGQQVRIYRDASTFGLYTVSEVRPETDDTVVRMGPSGRERRGIDTEFPGVLDSRVPRSRLSEYRARAKGELVERLSDDGGQSQLIAIAPTAATSSPTPTTRPSGSPPAWPPGTSAPGAARAGSPAAAPSPAGTSPPPTSTKPASPAWPGS